MPKLDVKQFVAGRDAYVGNVPLVQVLEQADQISTADSFSIQSFFLGFFDGVLADVRLAAKNAREEIDQRG